MKTKNKIATLCLAFVMVVGMIFTGSVATVNAATGPAPSDWAFEESSRNLNDAIVATYPTLGDANGYVTIPAANVMTGVLNLSNKNITGTMNGIENFTAITQLSLHGNNVSGTIPSDIGNMTQLTNLYLGNNQITGSLPTSIGDLVNLKTLSIYNNNLSGSLPVSIGDLTSLEELYLYNNQLTGSLPTSIGNLNNVKILNVLDNQLSGAIPSEIGNLVNLTTLYLRNNQLTGEIPTSLGNLNLLSELFLANNNLSGVFPGAIGNLPNLKEVEISNNNLLTGDITTTFEATPQLKLLSVYNTATSQLRPNNASLSVFLYDVLNKTGDNLAAGITMDQLTKLRDELNILKTQIKPTVDFSANTTNTWVIDSISPLESNIVLAEQMIGAKDKVDTLLETPDLSDLKAGITEQDINDAQVLVTALPNGELKAELQAKIDTARKLLDAENKVVNLFNPDGTLAPGVDQDKIDEAQNAVNLLSNGITKNILQSLIDEAQKQLNQKGLISKPSTKPSIDTGNVASTGPVSTADTTNLAILYAMLGMSLLGLVVATKRSKKQ